MPKLRQSSEKRQHPRVNKSLPIKINNQEFDIVTETKNISCVGAYCQVDKYVAPFTKIKTTVIIPAKKKCANSLINCEGTVVRVEKIDNALEQQYNIAIYFNQISKTNISKIDRFVKQYLSCA